MKQLNEIASFDIGRHAYINFVDFSLFAVHASLKSATYKYIRMLTIALIGPTPLDCTKSAMIPFRIQNSDYFALYPGDSKGPFHVHIAMSHLAGQF